MNYSYIVGNDSATITDFSTGKSCTLYSSDSRYAEFIDLIKTKSFAKAIILADVAQTIEQFVSGPATFAGASDSATFAGASDSGNMTIEARDGVGYYKFGCFPEQVLNDVLVSRIVKMKMEGFDAQPLINFIANVVQNPTQSAIDELYLFLEQTSLPLTEDGCFIAYKIVRNDYSDVYTGLMKNTVGETVSMPRKEVDPDRNNTCSRGLHFCSKNYLTKYSSHNSSTDRCVLVKVNPADVVSIPSDYNNAKGRTWKYVVVGELPEGWRATTSEVDYNVKSVVDIDGEEIQDYDEDELEDDFDSLHDHLMEVFDNFFSSDDEDEVIWEDSGRLATTIQVRNKLNKYCHPGVFVTVDDVRDMLAEEMLCISIGTDTRDFHIKDGRWYTVHAQCATATDSQFYGMLPTTFSMEVSVQLVSESSGVPVSELLEYAAQ